MNEEEQYEKYSPDMLRNLRSSFCTTLHEFATSPSTFKVLRSVRSGSPSGASDAKHPRTLYVLDSSFNPPSRAHMLLAQKAVQRDGGSLPRRVLFLLAIENADKKPKPAPFEDRLVMMKLMAEDLLAKLKQDDDDSIGTNLEIDVGVTKKPFFMDKAASIDESGVYGDGTQQVHLTGYDTLIRIFNAKYYPPDKQLSVLDPFLSKHRLRVCYREGDSFAGRAEQDAYVTRIGDGSRAAEGMKAEWRNRIELVNDAEGEAKGVSSTEARNAAQSEEWVDLRTFIGDAVASYIEQEKLYITKDSG